MFTGYIEYNLINEIKTWDSHLPSYNIICKVILICFYKSKNYNQKKYTKYKMNKMFLHIFTYLNHITTLCNWQYMTNVPSIILLFYLILFYYSHFVNKKINVFTLVIGWVYFGTKTGPRWLIFHPVILDYEIGHQHGGFLSI